MSTPNFGTTNFELPLMVFGTTGQLIDSYYDGEENVSDDALCDALQMEYDSIKDYVLEINNELDYFEVIIEPGYYDGAMLNAEWISDYVNYEQVDELDGYDAEYFFGDDAKTFRKQVKDEMKRIREYFKNLKYDNRFIELSRVGIFSNGEAIYRKVGI